MSRILIYLGAGLCVACGGGGRPAPFASSPGGEASGTGGTTVATSSQSGGAEAVGGTTSDGGTGNTITSGTSDGGVVGGTTSNGGTGNTIAGGTSDGGVAGGLSGIAGATSSGGTIGTGGMVTSTETGGNVSTGGATSLCSPSAQPGSSQAVTGVTLANNAWFAAITPDELTIVWTAAGTDNSYTVYVADRTSASASFSTPQSIGISTFDNLVTISPNGLRIAYVSADGRGIDVLSRTSRTETFQTPTGTWDEFSNFNATGALATGETYLRPLYGPIPTDFLYGVTSSTGDITWYASYRTSDFDVFPLGFPLSFLNNPSNALVLSGISGDNATLLFLNGTASDWSFLNSAGTAYSSPASLGPFGIAQVNQDCSRLYFGSSAGSISFVPLT